MKTIHLRKTLLLVLTFALVILAACSPAAPTTTTPTAQPSIPPTAAPTIAILTAQPSNAPTTTATTQSAPLAPTTAAQTIQPPNNPTTPSTTSNDAEIPSGVTADGFYYLGSPDAKVTLIDYSDFL